MATKPTVKKVEKDSMSKLFEEAIADAKTLRETAMTNAKKALEEAFAPKLQAMFSEKVRQEVEGDEDGEYENPDEPNMIEGEEGEEFDTDVIEEPAEDELSEEDGEEITGEEDITPEPEDGEVEDFDFDFDLEDDEDLPAEDELTEEGEEMEEPTTEDELEVPELEEEAGEEVPEETYGEPDVDDMELEAIIKELEGEDEFETEEPVEDELTEEDEAPIVEPTEDEDDIDLDEVLASITEEDEVEEEPKESEELQEAKRKNAKLTKQIKEAVKVITFMKSQLTETNLLNSKLLFANKIFKSNDKLTEGQKMKVIDQFDRATTLREVKLIYTTLIESLKAKPVKQSSQVTKLTEGIASKITGTTKPSKKVISESNAIVNRLQKLANLK